MSRPANPWNSSGVIYSYQRRTIAVSQRRIRRWKHGGEEDDLLPRTCWRMPSGLREEGKTLSAVVQGGAPAGPAGTVGAEWKGRNPYWSARAREKGPSEGRRLQRPSELTCCVLRMDPPGLTFSFRFSLSLFPRFSRRRDRSAVEVFSSGGGDFLLLADKSN